MKGLVIKDIIVMKYYLPVCLALAACAAAFVAGAAIPLPGFATMLGTFIGGMAGLAAFAYDETSRWDRYVLALPCTKKQVVGARFLFLLLTAGIGMGAGVLAEAFFARPGWPIASISGGCVVFPIFALMTAAFYLLGPEKGRIIGVPAGVALGMLLFPRLGVISPRIAVPAAFITMLASFLVSCRAYAREKRKKGISQMRLS
ncbi:ABC-2 transporter permease [Christensenella intestinihominis]|uniref:ABC-2 transporter permease n=1 Tax=Christensenella intestinihominis TaxID=1851429 RepID=UPI00082A2C50|nr:ABC-2 transporter permease [Christensenella intestinihominis]